MKAINKLGFTLKKHLPEILMGAGTVAFAGTVVFVIKGKTKADALFAERKEQLEKIEAAHQIALRPEASAEELSDELNVPEYVVTNIRTDGYSEQDYLNDIRNQKVATIIDGIKAYAPAVGLGLLSLGCFGTGFGILKYRHNNLTSAYTELSNGYKNVRNALISEFGIEKATKLLNGIREEKTEETIIDDKGKEKKVVKNRDVIDDPKKVSPYAEFFSEFKVSGERNAYWKRDPELRHAFLVGVQSQANELLRLKTFLYLNDVLPLLGLDKTKEGQVVGWIYDPNKTCNIVFNIPSVFRMTGEEVDLIDFNVDGNIWNKLDTIDYQEH